MPPQPKQQQDPALLDGASSRFATAFTRRTTQTRDGGDARPRPWAWPAGAVAVTVCVLLIVFAVSKIPSGSDAENTAKPAPTATKSALPPNPSSSPRSRVGSSAPGRPDKPGSPGHKGGDTAAHNGAAAGGTPSSPSTGTGSAQQPTGSPTGSAHEPSDSPTGSTQQFSGSNQSNGSGTSGGQASTGDTRQPTTTTYPGVSVYSHASGRCVTAGGSQNTKAKDGTRLVIWSCVGGSWQKIDFRSDGTARMFGLCMDIAWASSNDGAAIQLANCNGGWAQQFKLNSAHDLVNTQIGKCVDVTDGGSANGTVLQLWSCGGTDNQKWSKS
ncbi:ricin-type beta-trefoil lectin domain protein [Streptomyces sp. NBC_00433]